MKRMRVDRGRAGQVTKAGVLGFALALGWSGDAAAQGRGIPGPDVTYVALGVSGLAIADLNDRMEAAGYPTFGRTAVAPSLGAYWRLPGGYLLGAEWHGLVLAEQEHEGGEVGLGSGYGTLGVGYALDVSTRVSVYPRLGLGAGGLGLWIESPGDPVAFGEVLEDPRPRPDPEVVLNRGGIVMDLGLGAELLPGGRGRGAVVGLRIGYLVAPWNGDWVTHGDVPVTGGPDASIAGPYFRLLAGWTWGP